MLEALSGALRLDADARGHLFRLAGIASGDKTSVPSVETVSPALRQLMNGYAHTPAAVLSRTLDFLSSNALCGALYAPFEPVDNMARMVFGDHAARRFFVEWDQVAEATVAHLRLAAGFRSGLPGLRQLVRSLTDRSPDFARLWNTHAVRAKTQGDKQFLHPDVGPLTLTYQVFDVRDAPGQQLVIYHAEPGSTSAQALELLGSLHATRHSSVHDREDDRFS
ncbi:XRE family transcriptional regulator OS=Streptomyces alboniger OX=132473 GN=CP975_22175 PE=4 SV=1 [Streptomyces alboniger]